MIVFFTRYKVVNELNAENLLNFAFKCVNGMKNVPKEFLNCNWDGKDSYEIKVDRNIMAYEIDSISGITAFRVGIDDQNNELWTIDIILYEKQHEIQLRLSREKLIISAEYRKDFHIPYMFKQLIRERISGYDFDLLVSDCPTYIDISNINIVADIINQYKKYDLPVVYISHPFNSSQYEVDVKELAKDLAGSAHVLVEKESSISLELKQLTNGKNPYNGAIDIFYSDYSFRYLSRYYLSPNQFRYAISHSVFSRMAMRNFDAENSIGGIQLRKKIDSLSATRKEKKRLSLLLEKEKAEKEEFQNYYYLLLETNNLYEKKINELENTIGELKEKISKLETITTPELFMRVDSV